MLVDSFFFLFLFLSFFFSFSLFLSFRVLEMSQLKKQYYKSFYNILYVYELTYNSSQHQASVTLHLLKFRTQQYNKCKHVLYYIYC